jgi:hypothetical protein
MNQTGPNYYYYFFKENKKKTMKFDTADGGLKGQ